MLFFTACDSQSDEETDVFSISEEKRKEYEEKIDKLLYDNYWRYDGSSITFFKGIVPENTEKNKDMFEASSMIGLNMNTNATKEAIIATVPLLYYNGETAGLLYCYFVRDKLIGAYYTGGYNNGNYALTDRNVFLMDGHFSKYETDTPFAHFIGTKAHFHLRDFVMWTKIHKVIFWRLQ